MKALSPRSLAWIAAAVVGIGVSLSPLLDASAQDRNGSVFRTALLTFAAARGLDAAISLAQGTEIALQPAGVGVTLSAGELLDPVNDLVEQLSSVMLVATTSLGMQGLLLQASAWWLLRWLAVAAILLRLAMEFAPASFSPRVGGVVRRAFVLILMARFAMPAYALFTGMIFDRFLQPSQISSVQLLDEATEDVRAMQRLDEPPADAEEAGWLDSVSAWFSDTMASLDVEQRIEAFRERVAAVAEQVIQLIVVFVLQTVVLPLAFLWGLPRLLSAAVAATAPRR